MTLPIPTGTHADAGAATSWPARAFARIPHDVVALVARLSIAATFWLSGQTKVDGFKFDPIGLEFRLGWPSLSDTALMLFEHEYALPLLPPALAALMAAVAEHVFPLLLVLGLATRASAAALLGMTLVIQLFVYPAAWPTHGIWAAAMLLLMAYGPGRASLDAWLARRRAA